MQFHFEQIQCFACGPSHFKLSVLIIIKVMMSFFIVPPFCHYTLLQFCTLLYLSICGTLAFSFTVLSSQSKTPRTVLSMLGHMSTQWNITKQYGKTKKMQWSVIDLGHVSSFWWHVRDSGSFLCHGCIPFNLMILSVHSYLQQVSASGMNMMDQWIPVRMNFLCWSEP